MNRTKLFQQVTGFTLVVLLLMGCSGARVEPTATPVLPSPTSQPEPAETSRPTASASSDRNQDIEQAVDDFMVPYVEDGLFSGSVLIAQGGNILVSKGYGMANLEHDVPNTPHTKFRLAHVTMQFTAMAILLLQEQGQLSVQDPICDYIPGCPEAWQPITFHHLLTNSSGIPDFTYYPDFRETMASRSTVRETLRRFRDKPLAFTPGARFSFSNSGYVVLGYIIEQVSGKSYAVHLRDNIFQPLDMMNTGYDANYLVLKDRASGYRRMGANRFWHADYIDMSILHAAGGLYSTVEDLYLWDRALYTEALVSQSTLDLMFTPHIEEYGYGWLIEEYSNRKAIWHDGGINGFVTAIARFVDDDVVFIVLSNVENAPFFDEIQPGLIAIVFEE